MLYLAASSTVDREMHLARARSVQFALVALAACRAPASPARVAPADADPAAPPAAVVAALDSFVVAFNDLDSARFAARWATGASAFFPFTDTPRRVDGRDAVLARFATYFAEVRRERSGPPYLRIVPRDVEVVLLDDRSALATFVLTAGSQLARRTAVLVREPDGAWRIRHLHASMMGATRDER
jgi:ketosteroid isomerase-like protein